MVVFHEQIILVSKRYELMIKKNMISGTSIMLIVRKKVNQINIISIINPYQKQTGFWKFIQKNYGYPVNI